MGISPVQGGIQNMAHSRSASEENAPVAELRAFFEMFQLESRHLSRLGAEIARIVDVTVDDVNPALPIVRNRPYSSHSSGLR